MNISVSEIRSAVADLGIAVRCAHCHRIYDLARIRVVRMYVDCTVWVAPCCGREVDDRGETGWKSEQDYFRLRPRNIFPCDRCTSGWTDYLLCSTCRLDAASVADADRRRNYAKTGRAS